MDLIWEYRGQLWDGTLVTIQLAIGSVILSVFFGLLGAWAKLSKSSFARRVADLYTTIIRGIPDLVLMLLVFFGGQKLINDFGYYTGLWDYVDINQFAAAVGTIGFIFGAYMTETFRGAILAIPRGQIEAGIAYGMSPAQIFRRVIWPLMVRYALPSFTNNWLVLVKTTALASIIGLQDVVYNGFVAGRSTKELFTFMFAVMVVYLVITAISDIGLRIIERKYSVGTRRA